jgi:carbon storage regulator
MPMLVLARKPGEQIVIEGNIRLTVLAVTGNQVRIGIAAPPEITVDRQEVQVCRGGQTGRPRSDLPPNSQRTVWP